MWCRLSQARFAPSRLGSGTQLQLTEVKTKVLCQSRTASLSNKLY
ncbi:rCG30921 [Rattus norvegicus]|uniref:RCG30921 n=1 Tax=Rattus norvegicus TaxID=10116 RepID=A6IS52_RAT|nr:rCG30921 [Rattus norvegicus]